MTSVRSDEEDLLGSGSHLFRSDQVGVVSTIERTTQDVPVSPTRLPKVSA